jgi:4-diphosphocytidyl-2-C-methyl-D-erythritol kinase
MIKLRAYAKLNLSLKIVGKRKDGYHDIDSIMQSISLHDEVEIRSAASGIKVKCAPDIDKNIAEKAAKALLGEYKSAKGVEISIKKHIPLAAGLGGGAADAAAVLIGVNAALELNAHRNKLAEIGAKVGADVPFCLGGGTARVTGIGDKVERINPVTASSFIVVFPKIELITKTVYEKYDEVGAGEGGNDLENAAAAISPEMKKIKDRLIALTGGKWKMSGSGPTLFLELPDLSDADKYTDKIEELKLSYQIVKRMDHGVEIVA